MKFLSLICIVAVLFVSCSPAKMALDTTGWQNPETLAVNGKRGLFTKENMHFGEYRTTSVKRSWIKGSSGRFGLGTGSVNGYDYTNIISLEYIKKKQTIRFSMTDGSNNFSEVYCVSRFNTKDLTIGNRPNSIGNIGLDIAGFAAGHTNSMYYVQLYTREQEKPWEMLIDNIQSQSRPRSYTGYLSFSREEYYSIHPVYKMEGKDGKASNILMGMVGFEFRDKAGHPVAAVSLLNKGTVYLQPLPAERKFILANACAALLMQEQLG
ncbi:MAG: hypothetical protein WAR78_11805 [Ferruginibacter sp.]|nr:hypothetical protein [Chitinophagaceae bacterium]